MFEDKTEATLEELIGEARAAIKDARETDDAPGLSVYLEQVDAPQDGGNAGWDGSHGPAVAQEWTTWATWVTWVTWATR